MANAIKSAHLLLLRLGQCSFGRGRELTVCHWNMTDLESVGSIESHVPAWQLSSGRMSYFRGGPATDASGDQDGNFQMLPNSRLLVSFVKFQINK